MAPAHQPASADPPLIAAENQDIYQHKLDAEFCGGHVVHYKTLTREEEWWARVKRLGKGGQGSVYVEKKARTSRLRAVKMLQLEPFERGDISFK